MSEEQLAALPSPQPPVPPSGSGPLPQPALRLTAPEDTYWIRHLGLPFFYRHTPSRWVFRIIVYLALLIVGGLLIVNLLIIPYAADTSVIDTPALTSQFFLLAVVISCVLAPLFSTFSLASERATGTMEFLRLAPLSPTAVVLGKTFAPVYLLHAVSVVLLTMGVVAGLPGVGSWTTLGGLVSGAGLILMQAMLAHALGAFLASLTTLFRGFAAVLGLLLIWGMLHGVSLIFLEIPEAKILSYCDAIGLMDGLYWHAMSWRRNVPAQIFGSEWLVVPYLLGLHALLTLLLFRAAARRLDSALRTALSPLGHMTLWLLLALTCLGIGLNSSRRGSNSGFEVAAVLMATVGAALIGLMTFDHPLRRESLLARACERLSDGKAPEGSLRFLAHAVLVFCMTLLTATVLVIFVACRTPLLISDGWWVAPVIGLPPLFALLCCLILEANQVGLSSVLGRGSASVLGVVLLVALPLAATIDVVYTLDVWGDCVSAAANRQKTPKPGYDYWQHRYADLKRRYPERFDGLETSEEIEKTRTWIRTWPVPFFLYHHPVGTLVHVGLLGVLVCAILFWRWRAYRSLYSEARAAVVPAQPPGTHKRQSDANP